MRRRRPLIGARKYALNEMYSTRRKVRARRLRSVRTGGEGGTYSFFISGGPGGHYAARLACAPLNLAQADIFN